MRAVFRWTKSLENRKSLINKNISSWNFFPKLLFFLGKSECTPDLDISSLLPSGHQVKEMVQCHAGCLSTLKLCIVLSRSIPQHQYCILIHQIPVHQPCPSIHFHSTSHRRCQGSSCSDSNQSFPSRYILFGVSSIGTPKIRATSHWRPAHTMRWPTSRELPSMAVHTSLL